jgi:hypothetical protein
MDVNIIANIIFLIAVIFIAIGATRMSQLSQPAKQVYRYIPRSLEEEQKEPVRVEKIFKSMFDQQTPWIGAFNDSNIIMRRELDKKKGRLTLKPTKTSTPKSSAKTTPKTTPKS